VASARLKLYKGNVTVVGRQAPKSLYQPSLVTFEAGGDYQQADATGFIRLNALRLKIAATLTGKQGEEVKA
jgi:argininosuccinate synthase